MSAASHCPHCGVGLPAPEAESEPAAEADASAGAPNFCPACGRKVAGWRTGARASLGGAAAGGVPLPGGDEPTRALAPSPALLREAISKEMGKGPTPGKNDSVGIAPVRTHRTHVLIGAVLLALALGLILFLRSRPTAKPGLSEAPPVPATGADVPAPPPAAKAPSVAVPVEPSKKATVRRISAPPIAAPAAKSTVAPAAKSPATPAAKSPAPASTTKPDKGGALPHKAASTDSRSTAKPAEPSQPSGTGAAPSSPPRAANETVEGEARPMTETERRAEHAARADADGVRFVVHAHLPQVQACYGRAFKDSSPGGRVDIGFVIGPEGRASKIHTEANSTDSPGLAKCLEQRIAEWEFPRPSGGQFELVYPFVFSPGG